MDEDAYEDAIRLYIELNVNRFNKAIYFYQKNQFEIVEEVDIEIGNGYLMEDYVMKRNLDRED